MLVLRVYDLLGVRVICLVIVYIEGAPLAVAEQTWRRLTRFLRAALVSDFAPNLDVAAS